ncbi:hypothetical protein FALBO_12611 [Fusarium albosuccineum]|uniref:Heterokaryon incompatibility domain-containing protein n=1 Tax=Fusarium albosuccineum TaxID=1237068 RepID=A0A8H4P8Y7_9HYPO|nr:hypothetical protein FALBO_12611 [Fusarium albosuccineum]
MAEDKIPHHTIVIDYSSYHALDSTNKEIRLLRLVLDACFKEHNDNLVVASVRTKLSNHAKYRALSSCWGSLEETRPITVLFADSSEVSSSYDSEQHNRVSSKAPTVEFQITTNLHDALLSFYQTNEEGFFWVDAICINQGDIDERSSQVSFMKSVYNCADSVLVWLGDSPEMQSSVCAPENYDIALFNMLLEDKGWSGDRDDFFTFFARSLEDLKRSQDEQFVKSDLPPSFTRLLPETRTTHDGAQVTGSSRDIGETSEAFQYTKAFLWVTHKSYINKWTAQTVQLENFEASIQNWSSTIEDDLSVERAFQSYCSRILDAQSELWQLVESLLSTEKQSLGLYSHYETMGHRMSIIAKSPWFRRVWVIQEVTSDPRVRIRVGEKECSWEILRSVLKLFKLVALNAFRVIGPLYSENVPQLWQNSSVWQRSHGLTIMRLISFTREFLVTDPRDRVIALHELAVDLHPGEFKPNYRSSVAETYAEFTSCIIKSTRSLDVLHPARVGTREGDDTDLPSWVPDYTDSEGSSFMGYWGSQATKGTRVDRKHSKDWRALHVKGFKIARVGMIIDREFLRDSRGHWSSSEQSGRGLFYMTLPQLWTCLVHAYSKMLPAQSQCLEFAKFPKLSLKIFFETLLPRFRGTEVLFRYLINLWFNQDPLLSTSGVSLVTKKELLRLKRQDLEHKEPASRYPPRVSKSLVAATLSGVSFFFTQAGDLGFCPEGTQRGDFVAGLFGFRFPVILRLQQPSPDIPRREKAYQQAASSPAFYYSRQSQAQHAHDTYYVAVFRLAHWT